MVIADGISLEQTVLGHALNDAACYELFLADVRWEYFTAPNHRVIAYCMQQMATLGIRSPDEDSFQLVVNGYPGKDDKDYGGAQYIRALRESFLEPTTNYNQFTDRLKLHAAKVKIGSDRAQLLIKLANNPNSTLDDIRDVLRNLQNDIEAAGNSGYHFKDMSQLGAEYQVDLEERQHRQFSTTGFPALDDHLTEGFAPKRVSVLAGFTGMAKSTVAINMAHRIAVQGIGSAVFSMESTDISMLDKIVSTLTQIPTTKLKKETSTLSEQEKQSIRACLEHLKQIPLLINDQASLSVDGMLYQLQAARRRGYDPKVVFIDLFGKIEDVDTGENLAQRIQKECKRMRVLAKELDIHFVLVVQVGRSGFGKLKGGNIRRPTLIDIKNANAYSEEADIVILLHRNKYYEKDLEDDILEFDIAKQRGGEANIKVYFELFADTSTIMDTDKKPHDITEAA